MAGNRRCSFALHHKTPSVTEAGGLKTRAALFLFIPRYMEGNEFCHRLSSLLILVQLNQLGPFRCLHRWTLTAEMLSG